MTPLSLTIEGLPEHGWTLNRNCIGEASDGIDASAGRKQAPARSCGAMVCIINCEIEKNGFMLRWRVRETEKCS